MTTDFFNIDSVLSEEERAVRDSVRRFVDERVLPVIGKCYVDGRFPREIVPVMAELGLLGANLPEEYGCAGLNNVAYGLIMQELERGDSGVRSFASVQGSLVMYPIYAFGSDEQKRRYLPAMASGEIIGCFGLTEPDYGSNPAGMITTAREQPDGSFVLNGAKMWITNGSTAHVAIVWAKTGQDEGSIRGFIVPTDAKGFSAKDQKGKLSLRASDTSELVFQDVLCAEGAAAPRVRRAQEPAHVPHAGALRHCVGRGRRCDRVLRGSREVFQDSRHVRPADRWVPAAAGASRRHADGDREGAAGVTAPGAAQGCRDVHAAAGLAGEAQQRRHGNERGP